MRARIIAILVVLTALALNVPSAQASVQPIVTVDSFFSALNAGDHQAALAVFTPDATATLARGESYNSPAEIAELVRLLEHPGRHYEVVEVGMIDETVSFRVAVSDQGIRWGEATIVAEVQAGKLHSYRETAFTLKLGS